MAYTPPPLKHYEASYAIIHKATNECVAEMQADDKRIPNLNTKSFKAVPIATYLASLNNAGAVQCL